ncbi:hypothetical protein [Saccharothrix texasensis]|uniref:hypothetical protein n=1 Tax=Saccharothrix texasensis TaxID=103734 RepID=UPI0014770DEB|nr:hypothetical protein [Saccharothrix texasensis]
MVEIAPAPRGGGAAVDFRGETHPTALERRGVGLMVKAGKDITTKIDLPGLAHAAG